MVWEGLAYWSKGAIIGAIFGAVLWLLYATSFFFVRQWLFLYDLLKSSLMLNSKFLDVLTDWFLFLRNYRYIIIFLPLKFIQLTIFYGLAGILVGILTGIVGGTVVWLAKEGFAYWETGAIIGALFGVVILLTGWILTSESIGRFFSSRIPAIIDRISMSGSILNKFLTNLNGFFCSTNKHSTFIFIITTFVWINTLVIDRLYDLLGFSTNSYTNAKSFILMGVGLAIVYGLMGALIGAAVTIIGWFF